MEARGVLKSHPAPPCLPRSPTLARGTSDRHCARLSSPARPFVSPLFCVNQMAFVRSQTCCVHTHTNIPAQSVGNAAHIQIMRCTLPGTNAHTRTRGAGAAQAAAASFPGKNGARGCLEQEVARVPVLQATWRVSVCPWGMSVPLDGAGAAGTSLPCSELVPLMLFSVCCFGLLQFFSPSSCFLSDVSWVMFDGVLKLVVGNVIFLQCRFCEFLCNGTG